jgi:hypothetical protein
VFIRESAVAAVIELLKLQMGIKDLLKQLEGATFQVSIAFHPV